MKGFAQVYILDLPFHADRPFVYSIPTALQAQAAPGSVALLPFGKGNTRRYGIITQLQDECAREQIKAIDLLLPPLYSLSQELLGLCAYLKEHCFCSFGAAARCMLPSLSVVRPQVCYTARPEKYNALLKRYGADAPQTILYLSLLPQTQENATASSHTPQPHAKDPYLAQLVRGGYLTKTWKAVQKEDIRYLQRVTLQISAQHAYAIAAGDSVLRKQYGLRTRSTVYPAALQYLLEHGPTDTQTLAKNCGVTAPQLHLLEKNKIIRMERIAQNRSPFCPAHATQDPNILNAEQQSVFKGLAALLAEHTAHAALLYGVTGSGKTRVIKALCDRVIADGKQIILLVPEIALTPQSLQIFCAYYKDRVAVLHSALSEGEKLDEWRRIRHGEVDLVIGTRSAVFAPVPSLGMLVIDEEQEHTYQSEQDPKYHARDAARYRCAKNGALLLLASATPSLESYYKAQQGIYSLFKLQSRYGGAALPQVLFADMRQENREDDTTSFLSAPLLRELQKNEKAGEQSILFLNRRGYHNYVACFSCGEPLVCPHCSVTLTAHLPQSRRKISYDAHGVPEDTVLLCHYCGYRLPKPQSCPACGSVHLKYFGAGTQRAEDVLHRLLPHAKVLRMDADTTRQKNGHTEILRAFRAKEADILLGTQMVTKGHDFPNVTLSAVLQADALLAQDDYRAKERAFSLITQVVGRAGRAGGTARAVIQTYNPDNETLRLAAAQDYQAFYDGAIALRRALAFPPFCNIALFSVSGTNEALLETAMQQLTQRLQAETQSGAAYADVPLELFGPFEAQIYRVNEICRKRLIVKCRSNPRTRALFALLMQEYGAAWDSIHLSLTMDPANL